jgi:nitroreductase
MSVQTNHTPFKQAAAAAEMAAGEAAERLTPEGLKQALRWRYAVKKFDPAKKIPAPLWDALEDALTLTPSSYGLQPWKFFVVDDAELRAKLRAASYGQSQITDADKLVVLAMPKDLSAEDVDRFVARIAEVRQVSAESLAGYRQTMIGVANRPPADRDAWAARQIYIALGNFLTSAAALGVDACPMEGLEPAKYDDILGLAGKGYKTLVAVTAGYRSAEDKYAQSIKVRFARADVVEHF